MAVSPKQQLKHPWLPIPYEAKEVRFIQALHRGDATPEQQREALAWIIEVASSYVDLPYFPNSDRDTAFACGKMFVGKTLVKMLSLLPDKLDKPKKE